MPSHTRKLPCALIVLLATSCAGSSATPNAADSQSTTPPPSPTATRTWPLDGSPPTFRFDRASMMPALPAMYRGRPMGPFEYFIDLRDVRLRDDPWDGQVVVPEACRLAVRSSGRKSVEGVDGFRSDTPAVVTTAPLATPAGDGAANVRLYELTGTDAVQYQLQIVQPAPECREFTIGSDQRGSIVERGLPEFGSGSRYVVRRYPRAGRAWIERLLLFQTPRFAGEIRVFALDNTEADFLSFARQVRTRAVRELGR